MRPTTSSRVSQGWALPLLLPVLLWGCVHRHKSEAKQVGLPETEYRHLTAKANGGDKAAAEKLARLWYQYSEDNDKVLYWLQVAAQNGSPRAVKLSKIAREHLDQTKIAEESVAPGPQ